MASICDNPHFYVPNLHTFLNGNGYLGSIHGLRFRVRPEKREWEVDGEKQEKTVLAALVWYGIYCLEKSQVVAEAEFPLDEEGHAAVLAWLDQEYEKMPKA